MKKMLQKENGTRIVLRWIFSTALSKFFIEFFICKGLRKYCILKLARITSLWCCFFDPHPQLTSSRAVTYVKALTPKSIFRLYTCNHPATIHLAWVSIYPFGRTLLLTTEMQWLDHSSVNRVTLMIISVILIQFSVILSHFGCECEFEY